jgi:hypothetical protein
MTRDEAKEHRQDLMEERTGFMPDRREELSYTFNTRRHGAPTSFSHDFVVPTMCLKPRTKWERQTETARLSCDICTPK